MAWTMQGMARADWDAGEIECWSAESYEDHALVLSHWAAYPTSLKRQFPSTAF